MALNVNHGLPSLIFCFSDIIYLRSGCKCWLPVTYAMIDFVDCSTFMGDYIYNLYRGLENTIIRTTWCVGTSLGASD